MNALIKFLDRLLFVTLALLMAAIVVDVTWQVFTRFVLGKPSSYTEELARFLLIWIAILGAGYAYRRKAHLGLDLITGRLTGAAARTVEVAALLVSLAFALLVMVYGGYRLVALTLELNQVSAALEIRMGYVYSVVPVSGVLISLYTLVFLREACSVGRERSASGDTSFTGANGVSAGDGAGGADTAFEKKRREKNAGAKNGGLPQAGAARERNP